MVPCCEERNDFNECVCSRNLEGSKMTRLTESEIARELAQLDGWDAADGLLRKEFRFKTFAGAMKFVNQVADVARTQRHHPEIWNSYNLVRLSLTTHDEGGISDKDVAFARAVEESRASS